MKCPICGNYKIETVLVGGHESYNVRIEIGIRYL